MAVEEISAAEHCAVVFSWHASEVHGDLVEVWAANPDKGEEMEFKKRLVNDGLGVVFFPPGYSGLCDLEIRSLDDDSKEVGQLDIGNPELAPE